MDSEKVASANAEFKHVSLDAFSLRSDLWTLGKVKPSAFRRPDEAWKPGIKLKGLSAAGFKMCNIRD